MPRVTPKGEEIVIRRKRAGYSTQLLFANAEPTMHINRLGAAERSEPSTIETILLIIAKLKPMQVKYDDLVEPSKDEQPRPSPRPATVTVEIPLAVFLDKDRAERLINDLKQLANLAVPPKPTSVDDGSTNLHITIQDQDVNLLADALSEGKFDHLAITAITIPFSELDRLFMRALRQGTGLFGFPSGIFTSTPTTYRFTRTIPPGTKITLLDDAPEDDS